MPRHDRTSPATRSATTEVAVDRIACTGHGVCAALLGGVSLDEWGYPVLSAEPDDPAAARSAVALCPARALYLRRRVVT